MFRFLQVVVVIIFLIGILLLFGKKFHRSKAFVTGLSIVLLVSSICAGVVLNAVPMTTEAVRIEATGESNSQSQGKIIGIKSVIVDGKEYPVGEPSEGTWYYSKDDAAYLWLSEGDERLTEPVTQEITIDVPVGAGRKLVFLTGEQFGIARVSYDGESETYDLYTNGSAVTNVDIPDSNRVYDDFVKLCRLGGYSLLIVAALALAFLLVQSVGKDDLLKLLYMTLSVITTLTFCLNMGLTARSGRSLYALFYDFNRSFSGNFVLAIILVPMLYKTFLYCGEIYRKNFTSVRSTLCIALPAGLFAAFMVIGAAFINGKNTLSPIFDNELQVLKSLFGVTGYFSVFFFGIAWIFNYLDCADIHKDSHKKYIRPVQMYLDSLRKRPFETAFVTFLVVYIPIFIISYPGVIMGDTQYPLLQMYGQQAYNNAHPITYVCFMEFCMRVGGALFESANAGIFIHVLTQFLFSIITVSLLIKLLVNLKISNKIIIFLILYYSFHPRIQKYFILITKDTMNAVFLLLFMVSLYMLFTKKRSVLIYILLGLSDLGALLFRHDSSYIIVLSMIVVFFLLRDFRKPVVLIIACTLSFTMVWNNVLLPGLNILPTFPMWLSDANTGILSTVMSQQTARYLRDAGHEVTEEEKEIISACFDYDSIVKNYQPDHLADGVTRLLKLSTMTQDDWDAYQNVWLKMLYKHPEIYVEATLNHKYEYLYPQILTKHTYSYSWSEHCMASINNKNIEGMFGELSYPEDRTNLRYGYEGLRETFYSIPIFNLLFTTASFFWILLTWLSYSVYRKGTIAVSIMLPLLWLIAALILGPSNGSYFRYTYPYAFCLPIVIALGLQSMRQKTTKQ